MTSVFLPWRGVLRALSLLAIAGLALLCLPPAATAGSSSFLVCNNAHDDTLYFAYTAQKPGRQTWSGEGWHSAEPGTCMRVSRFEDGEKVAFGFAVENAAGDLIPVRARPGNSVRSAPGRLPLDQFCGRRSAAFGSVRAQDTCPRSQMPVPVSFVLLPEAPAFGSDAEFRVPVYGQNGDFDLTALPPAAPDLQATYNPEVMVPVYLCNHSTGRVWITMKAPREDGLYVSQGWERASSRECVFLRDPVPEGTRIDFRVQMDWEDADSYVLLAPEPDTFAPGQFTIPSTPVCVQTGSANSRRMVGTIDNCMGSGSARQTTFSVVAKANTGSDMNLLIKGGFERQRTLAGP